MCGSGARGAGSSRATTPGTAGAVRPSRAGDAGVAGAAAVPDESLRRLTRVALLAAVALVLSYVETTIPLPLVFPGAKLGLANIAVLVALFAFDIRTAVYVAIVKVLAAGFLFGSPLMLAYSLGDTALALGAMVALRAIPGVSVLAVSMVSAVFHNAGQVLIACVLFGTPAVLVSFPPLAVVALVTGALTGMVAQTVVSDQREGTAAPVAGADVAASVVDASAATAAGAIDAPAGADSAAGAGIVDAPAGADSGSTFRFGVYRPGISLAHRLDPRAKLTFVALFLVAAFVAHSPVSLAIVAGTAIVALVCSRARPGQVVMWLKPFIWLFILVAAFGVMFTRTGDVLWAAGLITVTTDGVAFAGESMLRFTCMVLGTSSLMFTTSPEALTAGIAGVLAPLRRVGVKVDNAVLALSLTMQFIPVVSDEFERARRAHGARAEREDEGLVKRLRAYGAVFSPVFANALQHADELAVSLADGSYERPGAEPCLRMRPVDGVVIAAVIALVVAAALL